MLVAVNKPYFEEVARTLIADTNGKRFRQST